jgi:hypothetical protein
VAAVEQEDDIDAPQDSCPTGAEQPPGLLEDYDDAGKLSGYSDNPRAENLSNLPKGYYGSMVAANSRAWLQSRVLNQIALVVEGSAVWPMFWIDVHVARNALVPVASHPVTVGLDFGRQPAAIFMQAINNKVYVQYELLGSNEGGYICTESEAFYRRALS